MRRTSRRSARGRSATPVNPALAAWPGQRAAVAGTVFAGCAAMAIGVGVGVGAGVAGADVVIGPDGWPQATEQPSAIGPSQYQDFLTPQDAAYWNPFVDANRLTSPFGTDTRIACTAFHGVLLDCWQADADGHPQKLIRLPLNVPGSLGSGQPGGGAAHFMYPMGSGSA